jgi:hypothetical protein
MATEKIQQQKAAKTRVKRYWKWQVHKAERALKNAEYNVRKLTEIGATVEVLREYQQKLCDAQYRLRETQKMLGEVCA